MKTAYLDLTKPWTGNVPILSVIPNPNQPRKHFDQGALERTAASCQRQQIQPIGVIAHSDPTRSEVQWMIIDGERRWRGLKGIGATKIKISYDPEITADNLFEASLSANFCREGHTHEEIRAAVLHLVRNKKSTDEIRTMLGKSRAWVDDYRAIENLHPALLKAMNFPRDGERKVSMANAKLLATLKPFDQLGQWEKVKDKPAAEGFHELRTSGKVRHTSKRSPAKDGYYVEGKAAAALAAVTVIADLPLPMLKSLSAETLHAIGDMLGKIQKALDAATMRLADAEEKAKRSAA